MNTLYDLATRLDALTANSQQVLNALIRSCVAAGSSSGYKVNKYGVPIELTRSDIYHLYDFYQSWEAEGFPSGEDDFNSLLARADERWHTTSTDRSKLATDAVVKHSKILYMTRDEAVTLANAEASEAAASSESMSDDYWVNKVRMSASPKGTVSSAPIPLNLRTPLYDENLSVKSFSQFETYLFPMGYHRADIIGTPGNDEDYIAGGRNWTIDVTDTLQLSGNHIKLGRNSDTPPKLAGYGTKGLNISWGDDSYAFGNRSLAFGTHSVAQGDGAIVFGENCIGYGVNSFVAGGTDDATVGKISFATNFLNQAIGPYSFVANYQNAAGGWPYDFTFAVTDADMVKTECQFTYIESEDMCVAKTIPGYIDSNGLYRVIRISALKAEYPCLPFDLKPKDSVIIYDLVRTNDSGQVENPVDREGFSADPFITQISTVSKVYKLDNAGNPTDELDYYEITLNKPVPADAVYGNYIGGKIALRSVDRTRYDIDGKPIIDEPILLGAKSAVFGYANLSYGDNQTVVGQMSYPNKYAKFIVGVGSSYIQAQDSRDPYRSNGLVISDRYSYMKLANGKSFIGLSTGYNAIPDYNLGPEQELILHEGTIMRSVDPDGTDSAAVTTEPAHSLLMGYRGNAIVAQVGAGSSLKPYFASDYPTSVLRSLQGTAVISSGAYIAAGDGSGELLNLVDTLLEQSPVIRAVDEHGIAIYAEDGIDIRNIENNFSRGINIETCSYLTMTFRGLLLNGMTFRTLPATDDSLSFQLNYRTGSENTGKLEDIYWGHTTGSSGFYFIDGQNSNAKLYYPNDTKYEGTNLHLFNSGIYNETDNKYHIASLSVPESLKTPSGSILHPTVTVGSIDGVGGGQAGVGNVETKELAYTDDVGIWSAAMSSNLGYLALDGHTTPPGSTIYRASSPVVQHGVNFVMMPIMISRNLNTWINDEDWYARIIPNMSATSPLSPYHSYEFAIMKEETEEGYVSLSAYLNGSHIDIYADMSFKEAHIPLYVEENPSASIRGFRFAFIPGFAVQQSPGLFGYRGMNGNADDLTGTGIYRVIDNMMVSNLSGEAMFCGSTPHAGISDNSGAVCGGMALQCGIVAIDFRTFSESAYWTKTARYRFHVHGPVPFEVNRACKGTVVNSEWRNAMAACYDGKTLCEYSKLVDFLKDES